MTARRLGQYEILRELGRGGMGQVFLANDTRLGRQIALKVLPAEHAENPDRRERFQREARSVASLNHPNIVTLHSIEEVDGTHFLTMELVEGKTLESLLPEDGLSIERFFEIAIPLAGALAAAEEVGVVHRDLKPANIMVGRSGAVKVLDFGLAKLFESGAEPEETDGSETTELLTAEGRIVGTLPYMSPEQVQGGPVDHRSDIFSLGIIYYQMITGRRPFAGKSSADLISSILRDRPSVVSELRRELPRHLGRIVRHCLVKDPERRYQTAKDLRNDLDELQKELVTEERAAPPRPVADAADAADSSTSSANSAATDRRPRARWVVLAALATLLLAAAGLWLARRGGSEAEEDRGRIDVELAVLPFTSQSSDPRDDYLAEGLSAGLANRLDEIGGVHLASREALWALAEEGLEPTEIARQMSLSHLLEGEVTIDGDELRVIPRLIDGGSGIVVWSRPVTGHRDQLLGLLRELATELAAVLEIPLSRRERQRMANDPTASRKAYEYYLAGQRELRDRRSRPEFAIESFRQALRLDEGFALAYVGLSHALSFAYARDLEPALLAEATSAADRAVELDPDLPAAHLARARVLRASGRHEASAAELEEVLASHPHPAEAYRQLALTYAAGGDNQQARTCLEAAVNLDPESWAAWNSLGVTRTRLADYEAARVALERSAQLAPSGIDAPVLNLIAVALYEGDFEAAIAAYERISGALTDITLASNVATAFFFTGDLERAEELYRLVVELNPRDPISHRNLGDLFARQGRQELAKSEYAQALELIEVKLADSPQSVRWRLARAVYAAKADRCQTARQVAEELWGSLEPEADAAHKLAQAWALCGDAERALTALRRGIELGLSPSLLREEDEFSGLRGMPEFEALVGVADEG